MENSRSDAGSTDSMVRQYQLVLEQKYAVYDLLVNAGRHLDNKANSLIQAGGFIIALSAAVGLSTFSPDQLNGWALTGALVAAAAFAAMILISLKAWLPSDYEMPGTNKDWDKLFTDYMHKDIGECNAQVLRDLFDAINSLKARNGAKVRLVRISTWLLLVQVVGILVAAFIA